MGKVAAKVKVMPESPDVDLDALQERLEDSLPEGAKINGVERDDVAFGLVALYPTVIVPDDAWDGSRRGSVQRGRGRRVRQRRERRPHLVDDDFSVSPHPIATPPAIASAISWTAELVVVGGEGRDPVGLDGDGVEFERVVVSVVRDAEVENATWRFHAGFVGSRRP